MVNQFVLLLLLTVATIPANCIGHGSPVDWSSVGVTYSLEIPSSATTKDSSRRSRLVPKTTNATESAPSHDTCEAALDVQPEGPGHETVLTNQDTRGLETPLETLFPCDTFGWMNTKSLFSINS